jgi:hypothetical protein
MYPASNPDDRRIQQAIVLWQIYRGGDGFAASRGIATLLWLFNLHL